MAINSLVKICDEKLNTTNVKNLINYLKYDSNSKSKNSK